MSNKNKILLCFDAFGTLFTPKRPVHQQYAEVARSVGLTSVSDGEVEKCFKDAFKHEAKESPNFGKSKGWNAERWWTNIITNTFRPIVGNDQTLPKDLVPKLLHRFWSSDGYDLMPDVQSLFQRLQKRFDADDGPNIVVGVVTNSDDRVPDILTSLGLRVSPSRYGTQSVSLPGSQTYDIDFSVMSFDVGHEKPATEIFKAAEEMLQVKLRAIGAYSEQDIEAWRKIYVGDEHKKDVAGAVNAGWNAVLIGPHAEVSQHSDVKWLDDHSRRDLLEALNQSNAVGFSKLGKLVEWLPEDL